MNWDSILVPQWSVFVKNYSSLPLFVRTMGWNDRLCPDEVSVPWHCCKFVPKNKIDYLNFHFHIEKKMCSYNPICQKVIFIFDIFLNFSHLWYFWRCETFSRQKKEIWSLVKNDKKKWFMKLAFLIKKLDNKIML